MYRLRAELDDAADQASYDVDIESSRLSRLEYLQSVINETLRLAPAFPSGIQRTPPKGQDPAIVIGQ
jgi:cytochrome P450